MDFITIAKEKLNRALTENGDLAYATSGSYCLDYFSLIGGMRHQLNLALNTFLRAYNEDPKTALKILFYSRDIRGGLGERDIFRFILNALGNFYPEIAKKIIPYIPMYGRYDDLFALLYTPVKKDVVEYISHQLKEDIDNKNNHKAYSLLAKWMPSINTSNKDAVSLANVLCKELHMTKKEYRTTLSYLRRDLIVENNLRENDYSFSYETLPGKALFKYKNAFYINDRERFQEYLDQSMNGEAKMNTSTIYPYEVVRRVSSQISKEEQNTLDVIWKSFHKNTVHSNRLIVRDGSGSMTVGTNPYPIDIATSLAILMAEELEGAFHNCFMTFSSSPKIIELKGETIAEKVKYISKFDAYTNTNIQKVYQLILDVYKSDDFTKESALDQIVIISDMEFDCIKNETNSKTKSTFEYFKEEFKKLGYDMPNLVFWNVAARDVHLPVQKDENGVCLVSGSSQNIIQMITDNSELNPFQFMLSVLTKYAFIDELF